MPHDLLGHAAHVDAGAADLAGFDQRAVAPVHGGAVGRCNATAAAADDDVVVVLHGDSVLCLSGPNAAAGHLALFAGQGPAAGAKPGAPSGRLPGAAGVAASRYAPCPPRPFRPA